jgi:tRNA-specific 2-thiouridylase
MFNEVNQNVQVAVALSGGVDSSVAAALLREQGFSVWGVHLRLSALAPPADHLEALGRRLGIEITELDLEEDFSREVVDYFVREYARGRTPNPCVKCNAVIKFGRLWEQVRERGASYLATGHYARLRPGSGGGSGGGGDGLGLYRGLDRRKDQSYFLSRLPRSLLPHLRFPLGEMTKVEVRRRHRELELPAGLDCRESVELCFIPQGHYQEFITARLGRPGLPGELVDPVGRVLGRHHGLERYTVGQRRGLGVPAREPYYVVEICPETNRVMLGHKPDLLSAGLRASRVNWLADPPEGELTARAVIRYRHPGALARIIPRGAERGADRRADRGADAVEVIFDSPQAAVAPGQAVAFYQDDQVLGGAWIEARIQ